MYGASADRKRRRAGNNCALRRACERGHLEVAQWLHATFALTASDARCANNAAFRKASASGHLAVAQWLHTTFELTGADERRFGETTNHAFRLSCEHGHAAVARWLYQTFSIKIADVVIERVLTTNHGDIHDLIHRIYEESNSGPAGLDGDARANYEAARARILAARQAQQDQIMSARR